MRRGDVSSEVFSQQPLLLLILIFLDQTRYAYLVSMSCRCFAQCIRTLYPTGVKTSLLWLLQSLPMCKWFLKHITCDMQRVDLGPTLCQLSARLGSSDVLCWLYDNFFRWDVATCCEAIKAGKLEVLKFALYKSRILQDDCLKGDACEFAATNGHQDMLEYVRLFGCGWNPKVSAAAAFKGDIKMLDWLLKHHCPYDASAMSVAARQGHFSLVKWLWDYGCPINQNVCSEAACGGHIDILKWARLNHFPWNAATCSNAAQGGHFEVVKWAHENGCLWDGTTSYRAAKGGHFELLQYLNENGCPLTILTLTVAAESGNLPMVQWMVTNGCIVSSMANAYAAHKGHLDVVKWLETTGNRCDEECYNFAAAGGHIKVLQYLLDSECPPPSTFDVATRATRSGHLSVLKWMHAHEWYCVEQCSADDQKFICGLAAQYGHLDLLKWLRLNSVAWDKQKCMHSAAYAGHLDVVKFIYNEGGKWTMRTTKKARDGGHISVLWWANNNCLM